jgi:hypothetical protein
MIEKVQVIIIAADHTPILLNHSVVLAIVEVWKMRSEADIDAQERLSRFTQSSNKEIYCLNFVSGNIMTQGMEFLPYFKF